jgi:carboxypeptidase C (cathepsin A)
MRASFVLVVAAMLAIPALAQQNENQQSSQPDIQSANQQKKKEQAQSAKQQKPKEPAAKSTEPAPAQAEPKPGEDKKEEHFDMTEVAPVVTHHQVSVNGKTLKYSATTGRLPIKRGDGKIEAEMFFVAYTLDGQEASRRPVTFAFNGGPGSASIWLHMGALGPQRVVLNPDGFLPPAPYRTEAIWCWWMQSAPVSAAPKLRRSGRNFGA